jgi:hypothetical protein
MTLLKALKDYFFCIEFINTQYSNLVNGYTRTDDESKCRQLAEKAIASLDALNEKVQNETSPYLFGFSLNLGEKINSIFENYYDEVTKLFSKYSQPDMYQIKLSSIQRNFFEQTKKFVSIIYEVVKKNCPK